jgi:hypothetical protein
MSSLGDNEKAACLERMEEMLHCILIPGVFFSYSSVEAATGTTTREQQGV